MGMMPQISVPGCQLKTVQLSLLGPCKLCNCRLWGLAHCATVVFGSFGALQTVPLCPIVVLGSVGSPPPPHFDPTPLCDPPAILVPFWDLPGKQIVKTCGTISESIRDIICEIMSETNRDQFK